MRITIYRFERGTGGAFYPDGAVDAPVTITPILTTRGASSALEPGRVKTVTVEGQLCRLEHENGRPCVFLPKPKRGRRARRA